MMQTPDVNVAWTNQGIRRHRHADIAVAIATKSGLFTPVISRAEVKTLGTISREIANLLKRAESGAFGQAELYGGAVTVSNLGKYRVREFTAIINPPSSCILAVGSCEKRPTIINDRLAIGNVMTLTLSADHRLIDGRLAAEFLSNVVSLLERPANLAA